MTEKEPVQGDEGLVLIPAAEVSEQDKATLTLDSEVITVTDGTAIPAEIKAVDEQGNVIAVYTASQPVTTRASSLATNIQSLYSQYYLNFNGLSQTNLAQ
ncbi:hypothetical protein [Streptomyces violascens]|uniref:hypothetical protein n=1 Tax=Streptomyces violascens TaxID=67381 RepID=UPI00167ADEF0|nr:hypothetical protein [Streptomyces violascens]GGU49643.1 hypothetical protein GCM10010289_82730 [Streptomyces violascens]